MIENQDGRRIAGTLGNRIIATIFLVALCCLTLVAAAKSSYTVNVLVDGKTILVNTSEQSADIILKQAEVKLGKKDKLITSAFTVGKSAENGNQIEVLRAVPVVIIDDGERVAEIEVAGSVQDALDAAGVRFRSVDKMNYATNTRLTKGMSIEIQRAFSVDVIADGETQTVTFLEGTVNDVITRLGITLGEDDEIEPSLGTALHPGNAINVYRVSYEERTETETIKFKTINRTSSEVYRGTTKVEQEGVNGKKTVVYKDKIVDGKLSKSTKLSEEVINPAIDKIVVKGTKIKILTTSGPISTLAMPSSYSLSDGIPTSSLKTIEGSSTAYTASPGAGTASGAPARSGYVAVNPNVIPYGTEMYIVSTDGKYVYGYCIAADTGGFAKKGSAVVDVFMDTTDECYQWGRRNVCIYILKWGDGTVR